MTDQMTEAPRVPPWRKHETWIVLLLVGGFFAIGIWGYRQRQPLTVSDRLKEDMQMFALAINTYHAEEGAYPQPSPGAEPGPRTNSVLPPALTSPIGYADRLLLDPYAPDEALEALRYMRKDDFSTTGSDALFEDFVRTSIGDPVQGVDYVFWSRGPDEDFDTIPNPAGQIRTVRYDPTNGARSDGDLLFWGPAIGVRRNPYLGTAGAGRGGLQ